jgi:Outer membrane protein beta-barrel domain
MKRILFMVMLTILSGALFAGNMQTGMTVAYNSSNFMPYNAENSAIPGFRIGGLAQIPLGKSLFQAELQLASKGFLTESIGDTRLTNLFLYVELPLSIKYELLPGNTWNIYLLGGFSASLKVIAINLVSELGGVRAVDAGLHVGLGARYQKVELEARFDQSILNFDLIEPGKFHQTLSMGMNFYFRGK